jgi:hypothetical protein
MTYQETIDEVIRLLRTIDYTVDHVSVQLDPVNIHLAKLEVSAHRLGPFPVPSKRLQHGVQLEEFLKNQIPDMTVDYSQLEPKVMAAHECQPSDLKWYDSGITRFQYCSVCNKDHK